MSKADARAGFVNWLSQALKPATVARPAAEHAGSLSYHATNSMLLQLLALALDQLANVRGRNWNTVPDQGIAINLEPGTGLNAARIPA